MKRIDRETVQRIFDTANIVDVVSDFVSLKRRGANYLGLCPFHSDRTPSFYVSPAKNICKCFACGKGGSPVNFVMEHEQMTFNEALRYLAKKYSIEIQEHEMSDEEREKESAREAMFNANDFALRFFEKTMAETADGRDIGLAYFRERGITDVAIKRFHLGYSAERGNELYIAAKKAGFEEHTLVDTGLCVRRDDGSLYDRFRGRVIYPVHTISGKVVAFGGRTLRSDKKVAKYVNSPESVIYSKSRELYGLYQAKKSIVERKKCILVEGYMDVISMSQLGIENVVASSGTALTEGQIRLIHRFTDTVTVIYDSDAAGIKASLRGIDMLLAEGLKMKVVLLPDGEDPDSFAQSHSLTEVEKYIDEHETDFIRFKTDILFQGLENDPIRRSQAITEIVGSIAVIPDEITRSVYIQECSRSLDIDEQVLLREVRKIIAQRREKLAEDRRREQARSTLQSDAGQSQYAAPSAQTAAQTIAVAAVNSQKADIQKVNDLLLPHEQALIRYIIRYGAHTLPIDDEDGNTQQVKVIDYITQELNMDNIRFTHPGYAKVIDECRQIVKSDWQADFEKLQSELLVARSKSWDAGRDEISASAQTLEQIKSREKELQDRVDSEFMAAQEQFLSTYFIRKLSTSTDADVRGITIELGSSKHKLSKYHSKYTRVETEQEKLCELLPRAIYGLKNAKLNERLAALRQRINELSSVTPIDNEAVMSAMLQMKTIEDERKGLSRLLGDRVILPK